MKKLRSRAYHLVLLSACLFAVSAAVLALWSASNAGALSLAWSLMAAGISIAHLPVALHLQLRRLHRAIRRRPTAGALPSAATPAVEIATPDGVVVIDEALLAEMRSLRREVRLSLNNELHLLDAVQRLTSVLEPSDRV